MSQNYLRDELGYNFLEAGSADLHSVSSGGWIESSLYNFGRFFYGFHDKYLFTGTFRRDGFSGFSSDNKFGVFPSLAVAWVVSEENYLKNNAEWVDFLKLRLSYGASGNRTAGRYQTLAKVGGGFNYVDGKDASIFTQRITALASPSLKWETTTGVNAGIDVVLLNQRISGTIDYYNTTTRDLLYNVDIPGISRFSTFPDNLGKLHNNGLELSLNTINIKKRDIEWTSSFSFSRNRNKLKELLGFDLDGDGNEDDLVSEGLFIGKPLSSIYTYVNTGKLWQVEDYEADIIPAYSDLGGFVFKDITGEGEITTDDRKIIGYTDPSYRFSIGNKLNYKNWSLYLFLNSVQGGKKYYLGLDDLSGFNHIGGDTHDNRLFPKNADYWLPENPDARYQRQGVNIPSEYQRTRYISRNFVRLQNITLSYNIESRILTQLRVDNVKLYFNGTNLFTWTKWPGWDPETGQSVTRAGRPVIKSYTFGIDVKF
jgi:TonB-linked SusC/RagA family outer membrane protein